MPTATKKTSSRAKKPASSPSKKTPNPSASDSGKKPSKDQKLAWLRQMLLIRRFEEKAAQAFMQARIKGFCHLYIGQEALAVGTIGALRPDDSVITAYRDHGHALARGMTSRECMAELYGKATGCSKGKGGSMHFFSAEKGFYGGHGIVSGQTPLGAGLAFAHKYQGTDRVCLCYLGDGAINQGVFHESLNLAALWELPVIYIIENNEYAMGTSVSRHAAGAPLIKRALGYDMNGITANGMDIDDVLEKTGQAVELARRESRPTMMEINTYRYRGHSMSDPGNYRTRDELEKHKENDPILLYRARLMDEKVLTQKAFEKMDEEVQAEVADAVEFAEKSPEPELHEIYDDIFTPEDQIDEIPRERRE